MSSFPPQSSDNPKLYTPDVVVPKGKKGGQGVVLETHNEFQEPFELHDQELEKIEQGNPELYNKGDTDWFTDCAPHGVLNEFERLFFVNGFGWIPLDKMEKIHDAYSFLLSGEFTPQHLFVKRGGKVDLREVTIENSEVHVHTTTEEDSVDQERVMTDEQRALKYRLETDQQRLKRFRAGPLGPNYNMLSRNALNPANKASRFSAVNPGAIKSPTSSPSHYSGSTQPAWNSGMSQPTQPVEQVVDLTGDEMMDDAASGQPLE